MLFNFTRWRDRVRSTCTGETELEEKVWCSVASSSRDYLLHIAGMGEGMDKQGTVQDLAIYSLFLDIRVIVVLADRIHASSSEKELSDACIEAGFEGESEKRRVV